MKKFLTFNWKQSKIPITDSILEVKAKDFSKICFFVEESIELCSSFQSCFSSEQAEKRLAQGETFFLLREHGPVGHLWVRDEEVIDLFISKTADGKMAERFIQEVGNRVKQPVLKMAVMDLSLSESRKLEAIGFS